MLKYSTYVKKNVENHKLIKLKISGVNTYFKKQLINYLYNVSLFTIK